MRPSPQRISRVVWIALSLALLPCPAHAMSWSLFCSTSNWYDACDVTEQGQCKRHNNWGQEVDCIIANPPFPGPTDDVQIGSSGSVTLPAAAANILSMTLMGTLTMYGHTMTIGTSAHINSGGHFTVGGVTLAGAQPLELIGGESSQFEIANVSGFTGLELQSTAVDNDGLIKWQTGNIGMSNGSSIVNKRKLQILGNNNISWTGGAQGSVVNQSAGTIIKTSGGQTTIGVPFANDGLLQLQDGTLSLTAGGSNTGYLQMGEGVTLSIDGGAFHHALPGFIYGAGVVRVKTSGTLAVDFPLPIGVFELSGGTVDGADVLQIDDTSIWNSGTMQGSGTTRVASGANMSIPDTPGQKALAGRVFDNQGLVQLDGLETIDLSLAAAVYNFGTFQILGDGGFTWNHGGAVPTLNNTGSFLKTGGTGTSTVDAAITNGGLVEIQTGTLMARSADYTQNAGTTRLYGTTLRAPDGDVKINGGVVIGNGTLHTFVVRNPGGIMAPGNSPGAITCTGDYIQSAGGTLRIEIGGISPVSQHDVLIVTGNATVAGTIDLSIINGFDPALGAQFDVVTAASVSGTFGTILKAGLSAGKDFQVTYPPGKVRVTIVPRAAPMAGWPALLALVAALMAAGAWGLAARATERAAG